MGRTTTTSIDAFELDGLILFFRRNRWVNILGQFAASPFIVAVSWNVADRRRLLIFLVVHQLAALVNYATFTFPFRRPHKLKRFPAAAHVGTTIGCFPLGCAVFFDADAARAFDFHASVGVVLFACVAGAQASFGPMLSLLRVSTAAMLTPFALASFLFGHYAVGIGTLFFISIVAIYGATTTRNWYLDLAQRRAESADRANQAQHRAETDALTGLLNRYGLHQRLRDLAAANGASLLFVDLDRFKVLNDRRGHAAGDQVLAIVARRIERTAGDDAVVARIGGDEFVIVTSHMSHRGLEDLGQRLIATISQPCVLPDGSASVGASVGVASAHAVDLDQMLRQADQALYRAKAHGRGVVAFAEPESAPSDVTRCAEEQPNPQPS